MLLERTSELRTMAALSANWHHDLSAYGLAALSRVNVQSVYYVIAKLDEKGLLQRAGKKIRLSFSHLYAWRFKLLADADRILLLPEGTQRTVAEVHAVFCDSYGEGLLAAVLIGSAARQEMTQESDIDMLFIVQKRMSMDFRRKGLLRRGKLNLVERTQQEFERDYLHGDDFTLLCLRDGLVLDDTGVLRRLCERPLPPPSQETGLRREEHCELLRQRLLREIRIGDREEAVRLYRQLLIEETRVELLKAGELPGSKRALIGRMPAKRQKSYNSASAGTVADEMLRNA